MLSKSHTAVLERHVLIDPEFTTEPHEVAWVHQARWFVQVLEADSDASLTLQTEISPEGLTWCPHEDSKGTFGADGLIPLRIDYPGPYTRLKLSVPEAGKRAKVRIYLTMKQ